MKQKTFVAALKFVSEFAAKNDVRYFLCGVQLERNASGWNMVATDGYTLAVVEIEDPGPGDWSGIIPIGEVKHLTAFFALNKKDPDVDIRISMQKGRFNFAGELHKMSFPAVDGNYPKWRETVEKANSKDGGHLMGVNSDYLAKIGKATKHIHPGGMCGIRLYCRGEKSAATVRIPVGDRFEGLESAECLIMPMLM